MASKSAVGSGTAVRLSRTRKVREPRRESRPETRPPPWCRRARVHGPRTPLDDPVVEGILGVLLTGHAVEPPPVGLVLGEQQLRVAGVPVVATQQFVVGHDLPAAIPPQGRAGAFAEGPDIAEPELRQHVNRRGVGPPIVYRDLQQDVVRCRFRVLHHDIEIPIVVEDAGVQQLVLRLIRSPMAVLLHQLGVGVGTLRVLVQQLQV